MSNAQPAAPSWGARWWPPPRSRCGPPRWLLEVLDLAHRIAPIGNPNAVSDAGVGAQLASASVRGAILNVRINLPYLPAESPLRETGRGGC